MDLFHEIPDAIAIVRITGGVFKQKKVFHRKGKVYLDHSGGFVRVMLKFGETWGTSSPAVTVIEISQDIPGLFVTKEPKYDPPS